MQACIHAHARTLVRTHTRTHAHTHTLDMYIIISSTTVKHEKFSSALIIEIYNVIMWMDTDILVNNKKTE